MWLVYSTVSISSYIASNSTAIDGKKKKRKEFVRRGLWPSRGPIQALSGGAIGNHITSVRAANVSVRIQTEHFLNSSLEHKPSWRPCVMYYRETEENNSKRKSL
jgi:hypothetical protein